MKILHTVESYYPSVGGMQEVVKQLSERLVRLDHSVTVASKKHRDRNFREINGVLIEEFNISGNMVNGYMADSKEIERYQDYLCNSDFDVIVNFAAQQWATDLMLPVLDRIHAKKIMVPTGFSGLYVDEYGVYFSKMKEWLKSYDNLVFLSNNYRDINFARENMIKTYTIIPNGAGEDEFSKSDGKQFRKDFNIAEDIFLILHVGSHTGLKGHLEAIKIFKKAKIKNSVFIIIGNYYNIDNCKTEKKNNGLIKRSIKFSIGTVKFLLRKLGFFEINCPTYCMDAEKLNDTYSFSKNNKRVFIKDFPRESTVAAYHASDIFLFPSNIECSPIVLFECMASKTPFIVTDVGNSKEIIEWSNGGELLPTRIMENGFSKAKIGGSAKILEKYYKDGYLRRQKSESGYKAWKEKFTWEIISKKYEKLYISL